MRSVVSLQILLLFFADGKAAKRSPLQVGLVSFTEKPQLSHNATEETSVAPDVTRAHGHKWVPGRVDHHSFIPAHLAHVYVPASALLVAPAVILPPAVYRQHVGGFGIGLGAGGHGAGHGYHVLVNF